MESPLNHIRERFGFRTIRRNVFFLNRSITQIAGLSPPPLPRLAAIIAHILSLRKKGAGHATGNASLRPAR